MFLDQLKGNQHTRLIFIPENEYQQIKKKLTGTNYYAVLYIPENILTSNRAQLFSEKQVPFDISNMLENRLERIIERDKRNNYTDYFMPGIPGILLL